MNEIERVKHDGAVRALQERIGTLRFQLVGKNWDCIMRGGKFVRLQIAIDDSRNLLDQMQAMLTALKELEPENE